MKHLENRGFPFLMMVLLPLLFSFAFAQKKQPLVYSYKVIQVFPHDQNAFTQGLVFENGILYEGTGLRGKSTLRKVDLKSGLVLQLQELPAHLFGEGITIWQDKLIQLTWEANTGFSYHKESFLQLETFYYSGEGWGLTQDGKHLIMSDGSDKLYFLDPQSYQKIRTITVKAAQKPVYALNELEYIKGEIYANILRSDRIARINPANGNVNGWIDLTGLFTAPEGRNNEEQVLNGIAYDVRQDRLFVTGKNWPRLFEIEITSP